MGVDEQETVEVVGARMIATAQLLGREADAMHAVLVKRADELVGCTEGLTGRGRAAHHQRCARGLRGEALA